MWWQTRQSEAPRHLASGSLVVTGRDEVVRILGDCCSRSSPALMIPAESRAHCHGRFVALSDRCLLVDLFPLDSEKGFAFEPAATCGAAFSYGSQAHFFMSLVQSSLTERSTSDTTQKLLLAIPQAIAVVESRTVFRVPIFDNHDLHVEVVTADKNVGNARPLDISFTGIQVEFAEDPKLPIGATVEMKLGLSDDVAVSLRADVRHRRDRRYGFFFPDVQQGSELRPPDMLVRIVRTVELEWLRGRVM